MNTHKNARLTVYGRELLVRRILEHGLPVSEAAQAAGVSTRTAYKWLKRFRHEDRAGLNNRSSRPSHCPQPPRPRASTASSSGAKIDTPTARSARLSGWV